MAEENQVLRYLDPERGLDLRSSNIRRPRGFASDGQDFQLDENDDIEKRPGTHKLSGSGTGPLVQATTIDSTATEDLTKTEILLGQQKVVIDNMVLTSSGDTFRYNMFYDTATSQYRAQLTNETTSTLEVDLALGDGESGGDPTVGTLVTALTAVTGLTATAGSTPSSQKAAWSEVINQTFDGTLEPKVWTIDSLDVVLGNATTNTALVQNALFYGGTGTSSSHVAKYDGSRMYRAGLPKPAKPTLAAGGGGSVGSGDFRYRLQYIYTDNAGNIVDSQFSDFEQITVAATSVDVTANNLTTDYNTATVQHTGANQLNYTEGGSITITGLAGEISGFKVGDKVSWAPGAFGVRALPSGSNAATFSNNVLDPPHTGRVTATTATTLTVTVDQSTSGGTGLYTNDYVSLKLYIAVWRTRVDTTDPTLSTYYLLGEMPNNENAATSVFSDTWNDAFTGGQYGIDVRPSLGDRPQDLGAPPPPGSFLANYRDQLIIAGVDADKNVCHFSEVGQPDVFSTGTNSFNVGSGDVGDEITGLGSGEDYLIVFKRKSIYRVTGDLGGAFIVDRVASGLGCVSHKSITEIGEGRLVFLSHLGPYEIIRGQTIRALGPTPVGRSRLEPIFNQQNLVYDTNSIESESLLNLSNSIGMNFTSGDKFLLCVETYAGDAEVYAYDYVDDFWSKWTLNFRGGAVCANDEDAGKDGILYLLDLRAGGINRLKMMHRGTRDEEYNDHGDAIAMSYSTHWEHMGVPSQLKKYLRPNVFSLGDYDYTLTVAQQIDFNSSQDLSEITLDFDAGDQNEKGKFRQMRARSQRLVFSNAENNKNVKISGYEIEFNSPYKIRIK